MVMIIIVFTVNAMVYKPSVITMADLPCFCRLATQRSDQKIWGKKVWDLTIWNLEAVDRLGFKQKNTAEKNEIFRSAY